MAPYLTASMREILVAIVGADRPLCAADLKDLVVDADAAGPRTLSPQSMSNALMRLERSKLVDRVSHERPARYAATVKGRETVGS